MTRSTITFLMVVLSLLPVNAATGQDENAARRRKVENLRCEVSIHNRELRPEAKNEIEITLINLTATEMTINSLSVVLSPTSYLSPRGYGPIGDDYVGLVNLETKGALSPQQFREDEWQHPSTTLRVSARSKEAFTVDLSTLQWGQLKSSMLPSSSLHAIAPAKYTLYVEIMRTGEATQHVSNRMAIALQK